jgi:hypothetical protein
VFELYRAEVPEARMPASQVVPALYPKERLGSQLGHAPPTAAFYQLELVDPEPSFRHAVVPALSRAGKALSYMVFLQ